MKLVNLSVEIEFVTKVFTCKVADQRCHWIDLPRQVQDCGMEATGAARWLALRERWADLAYPTPLLLMTQANTELWISGTDSGDSEKSKKSFSNFNRLTWDSQIEIIKLQWTFATHKPLFFLMKSSHKTHHDFRINISTIRLMLWFY